MKSLVMLLTAVALLATAVSVPQAQQVKPQPIPTGVPDLYNLGVLGGKADLYRDKAPLPDQAKTALVVKSVEKEGRAANAGLKADDIIFGAGTRVFGANPYYDLAEAIEAAEAQTDPEKARCVLKVLRGDKSQELAIAVRAFGDGAGQGLPGTPLKKDIIERGTAWLASRQEDDGSFFTTLSVENGLVALTSIAGMALMASGSTADSGKYASRVRRAAEFVMETVGVQKRFKMVDGKRYDQTNWSLGYGGLFLAAVYKTADPKWLRTSSLKRLKTKLEWVHDRILANMEESGGFAAGPGGPNALGYVELAVMSNFVLAALGSMQACGISVDSKKLDKAIEYLKACTGESGGVGYSTRGYEAKMHEVGRTAGAANALAALGKHEDPLYVNMQRFVKAHVSLAFGGHSTPTMHQLSVAMACRRAGDEQWREYWKHHRKEFTMVRCDDGAFSYRPTEDTRRLKVNLDRDLTRVWTTAHWLIILQLDDGAVPLWLGMPKAKPGG